VAALLRVVEVELGHGLTGEWGMRTYVTPIVERTCGMPNALAVLAKLPDIQFDQVAGLSGRMTSKICFR